MRGPRNANFLGPRLPTKSPCTGWIYITAPISDAELLPCRQEFRIPTGSLMYWVISVGRKFVW